MLKYLLRKGIIVGIILLFIGTSIIPALAGSQTSEQQDASQGITYGSEIHESSLDGNTTQDNNPDWFSMNLQSGSPTTNNKKQEKQSSVPPEILAIRYDEDIEILPNGAARLDFTIDVPPSQLQDMYRELFGAPLDAAVDEKVDIPEESRMIEKEKENQVTTSKSSFYRSIAEDHLFSSGIAAQPTSASMIPFSSANTFKLTTSGDARLNVKDVTNDVWRIGFGSSVLDSPELSFDYLYSLIGYARLMMESMEGPQIFTRTWTTRLHLPEEATLLNQEAIVGKRWMMDFSQGTYMIATLSVSSDSVIILEEVLVISESEQIIPQPIGDYKSFDLEYRLPDSSATSTIGAKVLQGSRGSRMAFDTGPITIFDITTAYTFEQDVFSATLTLRFEADATAYISSDEAWILLQATTSATLSVSFTVGVEGEKELLSWSGTPITINIQAGPVPIVIAIYYGMNIGIEYGITLSTTVSATAGVTGSIKVGAYYNWEWDGWYPKITWHKIWEFDLTPFYDLPSLADVQTEFTAWVQPYIEFPVSARLYHLFGPEIKPKLYVKASIGYAFQYDDPKNSLTESWSIKLGFSIWVGVVVGIPEVLEYEFGFDILDLTIYEWTSDDPGNPGVYPDSVDTEPPVTTLVVNAPPVFLVNGEYWTGQNLSFSFSAVDKGKIPTGINRTSYYAGTDQNAVTYSYYTSGSSINLTTYPEGTIPGYYSYYIKYRSVDNKSHYEDIHLQTINVDLNPPDSAIHVPETVYAYQTPINITATDWNLSFDGTGYFIMYRTGYGVDTWTDWIKAPDNTKAVFYLTREGENKVQWFATDGVWNSEAIQSRTISDVQLPTYSNTYPFYNFSTVHESDLSYHYSDYSGWKTSTVYFDIPSENRYQLMFGSVQSYHSAAHVVNILFNNYDIGQWVQLASIYINANDTSWHPFDFTFPEWFNTSQMEIYSSESAALLNVTDGLLYYTDVAPYKPSDPSPADGTENIPINNVVLEWTGGDPDLRDKVWYTISFGEDSPNNMQVIYTIGPYDWDETEFSWDYSALFDDLENGKTYYWRITANDSFDTDTNSPTWRFSTVPPPSPVYVDDDYYDDTHDGGHDWGNDAFATIQDGINRVRDGGIVYVYNGTYQESVQIYKRLSLRGSGSRNTSIDGGSYGAVVLVDADEVNVSGFTVRFGTNGIVLYGQNASIFGNTVNYSKTGVLVNNGYNNISSNNITDVDYTGIELSSTSHDTMLWNNHINNVDDGQGIVNNEGQSNAIFYNAISNVNGDGILLKKWSTGCDVRGNNIVCSDDGIVVDSGAPYNTVRSNIVTGGYAGILIGEDHTTVLDNNAEGTWYGICVWSDYNTVSGNSVKGTTYYGIYVGMGTHHNLITYNHGDDQYHISGHSGIYLDRIGINTTVSFNMFGTPSTTQPYGIYLYKSCFVNITNNTAEYLDSHGYYFNDSDFNNFTGNVGYANGGYNLFLNGSQRNLIKKNRFYESNHGGIIMDNICCYNTITENNINGNNEGSGISLTGDSNNNSITHNTLIGNLQGINLLTSWRNIIQHNTIDGGCDPTVGFLPVGVYLGACYQNNISFNNITKNHYGVYLTSSSGGNHYYYQPNTIYNNTFTTNDDSTVSTDDYAIYILDSSVPNPIMRNSIFGNQNSHGMLIESSSNQTISYNTFQLTGITIKGDQLTHWNKHIISFNTANGKPIRYYKGGVNVTVPTNTAQVIFGNCKNMTIQGMTIGNPRVDIPIQLGFSTYNKILQNTINNDPNFPNDYGITLYAASQNNISGNNIQHQVYDGILLQSNSDLNTIFSNTINSNDRSGIRLETSWSNTISKNLQINQNGDEGVYLSSSNNNAITNNYQINLNSYGIRSLGSYANYINANTVQSNIYGIKLENCQTNTITDNNVSYQDHGIYLDFSFDNIIRSNNITGNGCGIENNYPSSPPIPNVIANNNIVANSVQQATDTTPSGRTKWNDTYLYDGNLTPPRAVSAGNYWSDCLNGPDGFHGPNQNIAGADYVRDTNPAQGMFPRLIPGGTNKDWYPFVKPLILSTGAQQPFNKNVLDNPGRDYFTGGAAPWIIDPSTFVAGTSSAKSGVIGNSKISVLKTSVDGPGTLTFYWKVSSQGLHDLLVFTIDDVIKARISGNVNWQPKVFTVGSGHHEISWTYVKDSNDVSGSDCGWVDNVLWTGNLQTPSSPSPANRSINVSINTLLNWTGGDPDNGDFVSYEIYLGNTKTSLNLRETIGPYPWNQNQLSWNPGTLNYGTSYFWKIIARDNHGTIKSSPLWHFTTVEEFSLAAYWPFDEGSGTIAHDISPNHNHGTITGATWSTGYFESALNFHGGGQWTDGDCVTVPHSSSLAITTPFSVEAVIKVTGSDDYLIIVDKSQYISGSDSRGFSLYLTSGKLRFSVYSGVNGNRDVWGTTDLRDNLYHHVKVVWDRSTLRAYVDHQQQGEIAWSYPPGATTNSLGIGKRLSGHGGYMPFLGIIDDVRITRLDPPNTPSSPSPTNGATNVLISSIISWTGGDPNLGDIVTYDVYLEPNNPSPGVIVSNDQTGTSYDPPGNLLYNATYYWRILASDNHGQYILSPTWHFTTEPGPINHPPNIPSNPSPINGATNQLTTVDISWTGGDQDQGDSVTYDMYFEMNDPTPDILVSEHQVGTTFDPGTLAENSVYYWQIVSQDNHDVVTYGPVWMFTTKLNQFIIQGNCYYPSMNPVNNLTVDIINLNTTTQWSAQTTTNHYSLLLIPDQDIAPGNTIRLIARDTNESVNVTDHTITASEITAGGIVLDLIVKVHYRDLKQFPFYVSQINTGAMTMKMMMDYLMWNSTTHPTGPPSVYSEQTLYNQYKGTDAIINGTELSNGLNSEVDDLHHNWMYGYFFNAYASTNANDVLKQICIWLDYPVNYYNNIRDVDVPKPGHPNHVPIAIPTGGNYNNWMTIRGIHTDRNAWLPPTQLNVYGFWLNDPKAGGLGANTYVTTSRLLSTYLLNLNVPGDIYNGKRLAVTDPPRDIPINTDTTTVTFAETPRGFSSQEAQLVAQKAKGSDDIIIKTAFTKAMDVLKLDRTYADVFSASKVMGKPTMKENSYSVTFRNTGIAFIVLIHKQDGKLLEIQIKNTLTTIE